MIGALAIAAATAAAWPPAGALEQVPAKRYQVVRDVVYGDGEGVPLKLDLYLPMKKPKRPMPLVVFIHGGGWEAGDKSMGHGGAYAARGWAFASVGYRLSPRYRFPTFLHDVKCAVRYLRAHAKAHGTDPGHIGVWGQSAGGHLALMLGLTAGEPAFEGRGGWAGASSRVQAIVDMFGPTDLQAPNWPAPLQATIRRGFGPTEPELRFGSPMTYLRRDLPPTLVLHGRQDPVVPLDQSQRLVQRLKALKAPVDFVLVEQAGHAFGPTTRPTGDQLDARVAAFFTRWLAPAR